MPSVHKEYDKNIIKALLDLKPMTTFDNHVVHFGEDKRDETIYEHIANKKHHLYVSDIQLIPTIFKTKECLKADRNGNKYRTYICKRKKERLRFKKLKIVTELRNRNHEYIITIYPTN